MQKPKTSPKPWFQAWVYFVLIIAKRELPFQLNSASLQSPETNSLVHELRFMTAVFVSIIVH